MHLCASQTGFEDQTNGMDKISDAEPDIHLLQPEHDQHEMELLLRLGAAEPLLTSKCNGG
jgi:hypothetical protein